MSQITGKTPFASRLRSFAWFSVVLFCLGLGLAFATKLSTRGVVIGWGITLGAPILIGFYSGLFAWIGTVREDDPRSGRVRFSFKQLWLLFLILALGFIALGTGYFILDLFFKGTEFGKAFFKGGLSGLYCTTMVCVVFALPVFFGVLLAIVVGKFFRRRILDISQKSKLTVLSLLLLTLVFPTALDQVEEGLGLRENLPVETVLTVRNVPSHIGQAWDHLQFYEDTGSESTWLFMLGFPKPIRTEGIIENVGDITKCVYDKGYLVKRTTRVEKRNKKWLLEFDVIEQVNIEDKAIELMDGSFELNDLEGVATRLKLKTRYRPLMTPRWMWKPLEVITARSLHNHVIDKIESDSMPGMSLTSN